MAAGGSWTNLFGASPVAPSSASFLSLSLSANTALAWPIETTGGAPVVASQINVNASAGGLNLAMPPANEGSTGVATMLTNTGATTFTLTDAAGNPIVSPAAGITWLISLVDNTTANGVWQAIQLGATTSQATAASLAGLGLQALGSLLQTALGKRYTSVNGPLSVSDRASLIVWQGAGGTLQLDTIANLGVGWFASVMNEGTGEVVITTSASQSLNGGGSVVLPPGGSATVVCSAAGFDTAALSTSDQISFAGLDLQTFTATGTYTPNPSMIFCLVLIVGSGAGGGAGTLLVGPLGGGGGGAGEFALGIFSTAQIGAGVTVTIGAGGAANTNGNTTSFGGLLTALGGSSSPGADSGGRGGTGGVGVGLHAAGGDGSSATAEGTDISNTYGGIGGASFFGGGAAGHDNNPENAGRAYGSGGAGASYFGALTVAGAGAGGVAVVIEFS